MLIIALNRQNRILGVEFQHLVPDVEIIDLKRYYTNLFGTFLSRGRYVAISSDTFLARGRYYTISFAPILFLISFAPILRLKSDTTISDELISPEMGKLAFEVEICITSSYINPISQYAGNILNTLLGDGEGVSISMTWIPTLDCLIFFY